MRWLVLLLALWPMAAFAVQPDEMLADPKLEARARVISKELRCLVCQNQSIDDSDADLAKDLRLIVRERIKAGDSDSQVIEYIASRYGDFVRMTPPFDAGTFLLWMGPFVVLGLGAALVYTAMRRNPKTAIAPLSPEEEEKLKKALAPADKL